MYRRYVTVIAVLCGAGLALTSAAGTTETKQKPESPQTTKVYVPYQKLKGVFESEQQGVFLPYKQFQQLWRAAQGRPTGVAEAPFDYLISVARFNGQVKDELATLRMELTIDILSEEWVRVPIGLGKAAVSKAAFAESGQAEIEPLLQVADGQYVLVTRGKGRYVLVLDFVCQLKSKPGLHILSYRLPSAAITTLELLIPQENLKVDVEPMLAATTSQVEVDGTNATRLQAFLGSAKNVRLSWRPKTQAAAELKPVITSEQLHHIDVGEAIISHQVKLNYTIRRGGVDSFTIKLPARFRVTDVDGANIARWDIQTAPPLPEQSLKVKLFSPAKSKYSLTVKMERFLQQAQMQVKLTPVVTEQVFRRSGLIGITHSPRRVVSLKDIKNLARVDTGRLPSHLQNRQGTTAYRFITSDYSGTIAIETALPRITVNQVWTLGVDSDRAVLSGRIRYEIEKTGIFELKMNFPEPWKIESLGPDKLVDDFQLKGRGGDRMLHILLNKEQTGDLGLNIIAAAQRAQPAEPLDFALPLPDPNNLRLYYGQLILLLPDQLRAEVHELHQMQSISLKSTQKWSEIAGLSPVMAFEFRAIDRHKPSGAGFRVAVKPAQISAVVHRVVNIQRGSIEQEAVVNYHIRYAPVDTFYLKIPAKLADEGIQITGANIKEKPRLEKLPVDQRAKSDEAEDNGAKWAYYKIVLQSKVRGSYQLKVRWRRSFRPGRVGQAVTFDVEPILAAGRLSDQSGHIAIAKAETLAIGEPVTKNLIPADAASAVDLPYDEHRKVASLAFKYNLPTFQLSLPVMVQQEAIVFTTIVRGAIIEQVLARDGTLNTHATFLLATSKGDRLAVHLPPAAELTAVLLNGSEAPVETGLKPQERIVRLPPSAGQVSKFVLEISYGLKAARASKLVPPALPEGIPIQQSLWRLWIPKERYLLGYDRNFSPLDFSESDRMLETLGRNQPSQVAFKLPGQGKALNFVRQGAPGQLSVWTAGKEVFSVIIWLIVLAAGVLMLKLTGFVRVLVILAAALLAAVIHLSCPLLINQAVQVGLLAAILVVLLWVSQWALVKLPKLRRLQAAKQQQPAKPGQEPHVPKNEKEQKKQSEQSEE